MHIHISSGCCSAVCALKQPDGLPAWRKCDYPSCDMQMRKLPGRVASSAELEAVHSSAHVATMKRKAAEDAPCVVADFEEPPDNTTYMAKSSFDDALHVRMLSFSARMSASYSLES